MALTPNFELIQTPEAAKILGVSLRELEYWKQLSIGPSPIYIMEIGSSSVNVYFLKQEIINLSKDHNEFANIKNQLKEKIKQVKKKPILKYD